MPNSRYSNGKNSVLYTFAPSIDQHTEQFLLENSRATASAHTMDAFLAATAENVDSGKAPKDELQNAIELIVSAETHNLPDKEHASARDFQNTIHKIHNEHILAKNEFLYQNHAKEAGAQAMSGYLDAVKNAQAARLASEEDVWDAYNEVALARTENLQDPHERQEADKLKRVAGIMLAKEPPLNSMLHKDMYNFLVKPNAKAMHQYVTSALRGWGKGHIDDEGIMTAYQDVAEIDIDTLEPAQVECAEKMQDVARHMLDNQDVMMSDKYLHTATYTFMSQNVLGTVTEEGMRAYDHAVKMAYGDGNISKEFADDARQRIANADSSKLTDPNAAEAARKRQEEILNREKMEAERARKFKENEQKMFDALEKGEPVNDYDLLTPWSQNYKNAQHAFATDPTPENEEALKHLKGIIPGSPEIGTLVKCVMERVFANGTPAPVEETIEPSAKSDVMLAFHASSTSKTLSPEKPVNNPAPKKGNDELPRMQL